MKAKKEILSEPAPDKKQTSLYMDVDKMESLKYMAFISKKTQTDIIDEALTEYIKKWEKEKGAIPKR